MAKAKWRGGAMLAPVPPTMVTCSHDGKDNVFTVAWTGITNTIPPKTYISVRPTRHSYNIIKEKGEFVINLTPSRLTKEADYCGIYTGKKVNKFEKCKLTKIKGTEIDCPMIEECPVNIECRVTDVISLGSHDMFMADIVAVNVDEELFDKEGKMRLDKAGLICYAHGEYFELGKKIGKFGFSTNKKKKKKPTGKKA